MLIRSKEYLDIHRPHKLISRVSWVHRMGSVFYKKVSNTTEKTNKPKYYVSFTIQKSANNPEVSLQFS